VNGASTPAAEAARLWRARSSGAKRKKAFVEVRSLLKEMSSGRQRCMYCEDSEGTDIDHFCPKSRYPDVAFVWANYFHACSHCNSNEKRSDFPLDPAGKALLLDPSVDDPYDHIAFVPQTGQFQGVTERGETTVEVFGLQRRETLQHGRQDAWRQMSALVREYRRASNAKDATAKAEVLQTIRRLSFQSVVQHYVRDALANRASVPAPLAKFVRPTSADWEWARAGRPVAPPAPGPRKRA
jgi:uncharacterized protein (TIGR02646 family)